MGVRVERVAREKAIVEVETEKVHPGLGVGGWG